MLRLVLPAILLFAGCAYFNTFYNARKNYREGMQFKEQGQQTQAKGKFDKAVERSALVIKRWPRSQWVDDALLLIGRCYYEQTYYSKAIRHFDQLALVFPNSKLVPEAELYRGLSLLADKQYGPARVVLDNVRQRYPKLADKAAFHLAQSLVLRDEPAAAADSLAAFIQRYARSAHRRAALRLLAEQEWRRQRYAEAEQSYATYAAASTDVKERTAARLKIAACRLELGRPAEAAQMVQDVVGRYREFDDEAYLLMGNAQAAAGKPAQALESWAKVRGGNDYGAEAAFRTGKYLEEDGDFVKARAYYDTARTRRADSDYGVQAVKRLSLLDAFAAQKSGDRQPAEAAFLLAEVNNLNLEDYDRAVTLYQAVHDSFPETDWAAKALFARAWILRVARNDTAAAEPVLRQVIAEYPESDYADESRRWLGLPVPKRARPAPKPETTAARVDTGKVAEKQPAPAESLAEDTFGDRVEPRIVPSPGELEEERLRERMGERPVSERPPGRRPELPRAPEPARPVDTTAVKPPAAESVRADTTPGEPVSPVPETMEETLPVPLPTGEKHELPVVHFGTDSAVIGAADSAALRQVVASEAVKKIVVTGFCDPRASERYNQALGMRRAEAVRDFLVRHGIDGRRITVSSRGEQDRVSSGPADYWRDRRAVLVLE